MEKEPNQTASKAGLPGVRSMGSSSKQSGLFTINESGLPTPEVTEEDIVNNTDRHEVVRYQESKFLWRLKRKDETKFKELLKKQFPITMMHSAYPAVELTEENVVDIKTLSKHVGKVLEGKFLLCRTITPAAQLKNIETVVEDPEGKYAVRLILCGFSNSIPRVTDFDKVLPPGSFLAIKNPLFHHEAIDFLCLRCADPTQVELLSKKSVQNKFPCVQWLGEIPGLYFYFNTDFWWTAYGTLREIAEFIKNLGNVAFVEKRFTDAIRWYKLAMDYIPDGRFEISILSNTSATFLALRCYHRALEDAEKILEKERDHVKAVYRKAKALILLQKYEDAAKFVARKTKGCKELADNLPLMQLGESARKFVSELGKKVVDVDMISILQIKEGTNSVEGVLEFTGPIKRMGRLEKGKRPGLVATEDIKPGQLLLSSKAYAFTQTKCRGSMNADWTIKSHRRNFINADVEHEALFAQIAWKIHFQPEESGPELYELFTGPGESPLPTDSIASRSVDMKRIHRIVEYNSFGTSFAQRLRSSMQSGSFITYVGLWIVPSLLNYSCSESNATWFVVGDFFILRASRAIKKGEEVLVTLLQPSLPYRDRLKCFRQDSYTCTCRLCDLDKADEDNGKGELRAQLVDKMFSRESSCGFLHLEEDLEIVAKLVSLRSLQPKLNACLATCPVNKMTFYLFQSAQFEVCRDLLEKLYSIEEELGLRDRSIITASRLMLCNLNLGNDVEVAKWSDLMKKDIISAFGTAGVAKMVLNESMPLKELPCLELIVDNIVASKEDETKKLRKKRKNKKK